MRRALLALALAGCSAHPAPVARGEAPIAPAPPAASDAGVPAPPSTPPGCASLAVAARASLGPGDPGYFYEDRAVIGRSTRGAAYAFVASDTGQVVVVRLGPDGAPAGRADVALPKTRDRAHVQGAVRGDEVALASTLYVANQDADIELALVDGSDRLVWRTVVDPDPALDQHPAVAWGRAELAVAWLRGPYPSARTVRVALVDPKSGRAILVRELPFDGRPGTPSIVWDGAAYAVAWHDLSSMRSGRGVLLARVTPAGEVTAPRVVVPRGTNPDLCVTPDGFALAYDDDADTTGGARIHVLRLDKEGAPRGDPWTLGEHPDPAANPRKPRLAWTGRDLAVTWEVMFHASVFRLHGPEAYVAVLGPDGAATPATRLESDGSAELPALVQTGRDLLAVYARNRLAQGKAADIVSARLTCLAAPPGAPFLAPPGPCDVRRSPAAGPLAYGRKVLLAMLPRPEGGYAVLRTDHDAPAPQASFALVDRALQPAFAATLPIFTDVYNASLTAHPYGWAAAWSTSDGKVEAMYLDHVGRVIEGPMEVDATAAYGTVGIAAVAEEVVVVWGSEKGLRTALLNGKGGVRRAAAMLGPGLEGGDCALAPLAGGRLGLVFTAMGAHTETSALRFVPLDAEGRATGPAVVVSSMEGFLRAPVAAPTATGGLLIGASGPFAREVVLIELDRAGKVIAPERTALESYGFAGYGLDARAQEARAFAVDREGMAERRICGR